VTVRKVIEVYEQNPESSVRDIAREVNISPASADRIKRDYKNGLFDRDGFRYEKALVG
jgi:DNA-binding Lrp family transcriptional regulator